MNNYISPFDITNIMLDRISSIMKKIGKLDNYKDLDKMPILRRNNRIRSIHSSLAIEANSLSFDQVKDIIDGKTVIGSQDETLEDLMRSTSLQASHVSSYVNKLLNVMETGVAMTSTELMEKLNMKSRISFRNNYLNPALENGLIKMTNPDKPTSKNQMYYKV